MLGGLALAGHDPYVLMERYSFDQLALLVECLTIARIEQIDSVMGPITASLGGKWKPGQVLPKIAKSLKAKQRRSGRAPASSREQEERKLAEVEAWVRNMDRMSRSGESGISIEVK